MHQSLTDISFGLAVLGSLSTDEQVFELLPEPESGWSVLVGSNLKSKVSLFSMSKAHGRNLSEIQNKWIVISLSQQLHQFFCCTIIKGSCFSKKLANFSWKAVLLSPWWRHSKKGDFTFALQQHADQKAFHAGGPLLMCWSCMFLRTFS